MCKELVFDKEKYTVETVTMEGQTIVYRAYENIPYVSNPVDEKMERLSIFVPEVFYEGKEVGGYNLGNAANFFAEYYWRLYAGTTGTSRKKYTRKSQCYIFCIASRICCSFCWGT